MALAEASLKIVFKRRAPKNTTRKVGIDRAGARPNHIFMGIKLAGTIEASLGATLMEPVSSRGSGSHMRRGTERRGRLLSGGWEKFFFSCRYQCGEHIPSVDCLEEKLSASCLATQCGKMQVRNKEKGERGGGTGEPLGRSEMPASGGNTAYFFLTCCSQVTSSAASQVNPDPGNNLSRKRTFLKSLNRVDEQWKFLKEDKSIQTEEYHSNHFSRGPV